MKITFFFLLFFLFCSPTYGQRWGNSMGDSHWGVQVGMSVNIGTHITQVGLKIQGYYRYKFVQINAGDQLRFNGYDLSGASDYISQRINTGIVLLAGKRNTSPQLILSGLNHQSRYSYGVAYNYLWYLDKIGTTQKSGGFALHIKQISLVTENDFFAGKGRDRFRTSYAGIFYHEGLFNIGLNTLLWTGETAHVSLQNPHNQYEIGYVDLSKNPFGRISHGIVSISFDYQIFYGNSISLSAGIDDEHIRDILQNKFIHDKQFVPKKIRRPNPNYPMLDKNGFPVIGKGKKVAPAKLFLQLALNRGLTY